MATKENFYTKKPGVFDRLREFLLVMNFKRCQNGQSNEVFQEFSIISDNVYGKDNW